MSIPTHLLGVSIISCSLHHLPLADSQDGHSVRCDLISIPLVIITIAEHLVFWLLGLFP